MEDLFDKMIKKDAGFREFVEAQNGKTTEEIATEFGVKLKHCHKTVTNNDKNLYSMGNVG